MKISYKIETIMGHSKILVLFALLLQSDESWQKIRCMRMDRLLPQPNPSPLQSHNLPDTQFYCDYIVKVIDSNFPRSG